MEFRLKKLRKERNISQLKIALDLNMNQNTISRYENMEREADYEALIKFADYFGVSVDYLLGITNTNQTCIDTSMLTEKQRLFLQQFLDELNA